MLQLVLPPNFSFTGLVVKRFDLHHDDVICDLMSDVIDSL